MNKINDLSGQTFGRLLVICEVPRTRNRITWHCVCDCGGVKSVNSQALVTGRVQSCGCIRTEHGLTGTPLYKVWTSMRERCNNPKAQSYKNYGARGIKVCLRWDDFELFMEDMGDRPEGRSVERRDNDGDYEPSNCYWATDMEQASNTRRTRLMTAGGKTMHMSAWTRLLGGGSTLILNRLKYGWTEEEACLTPKGQKRPKP